MTQRLHLSASDADNIFSTYVASGVHTGAHADGGTIEVWDDETEGSIANVALMFSTRATRPLYRTVTPLMSNPWKIA